MLVKGSPDRWWTFSEILLSSNLFLVAPVVNRFWGQSWAAGDLVSGIGILRSVVGQFLPTNMLLRVCIVRGRFAGLKCGHSTRMIHSWDVNKVALNRKCRSYGPLTHCACGRRVMRRSGKKTSSFRASTVWYNQIMGATASLSSPHIVFVQGWR